MMGGSGQDQTGQQTVREGTCSQRVLTLGYVQRGEGEVPKRSSSTVQMLVDVQDDCAVRDLLAHPEVHRRGSW